MTFRNRQFKFQATEGTFMKLQSLSGMPDLNDRQFQKLMDCVIDKLYKTNGKKVVQGFK